LQSSWTYQLSTHVDVFATSSKSRTRVVIRTRNGLLRASADVIVVGVVFNVYPAGNVPATDEGVRTSIADWVGQVMTGPRGVQTLELFATRKPASERLSASLPLLKPTPSGLAKVSLGPVDLW